MKLKLQENGKFLIVKMMTSHENQQYSGGQDPAHGVHGRGLYGSASDPQIGQQMMPGRKWSPYWTANDPDQKYGMAWIYIRGRWKHIKFTQKIMFYRFKRNIPHVHFWFSKAIDSEKHHLNSIRLLRLFLVYFNLFLLFYKGIERTLLANNF